ncbi:metalloregulator ArsR/SmtB family transcription factor [Corynebacterium callunae]|uniref:ArsR/SmtB family transcription factor n=1 Tax=Corynebacterium callunae TaxID=1721 RepID=UPI003981D13A
MEVELEAIPEEVLDIAATAAKFYKALGDSTRLEILYIIANSPHSKVSANHLANALEISAPTVTHHMKKLMAAKLVTRQQCGKWAYFSIHAENACLVSQIFERA